MITLLTTEPSTAGQSSGALAASDAVPETAESFAALVAGDSSGDGAPLSVAGETDVLVLNEAGNPVDDAKDLNSDESPQLAALSGILPDKPSVQRPIPGEGRSLIGQEQGRAIAVPNMTSEGETFAPEKALPRREAKPEKELDVLPARVGSTAQTIVEGQSQRAVTTPPIVQKNPVLARPVAADANETQPKERSFENGATELNLQRPQFRSGAIPALPAQPVSAPSDAPQTERDGKRRAVDVELVNRATSAQTSQTVATPAVPPSLAATQAFVQAGVSDRREQDGKSFDRELAVGPTSNDRPITSVGSTVQAGATSHHPMAQTVVQQLSAAVTQGTGKTTEIALNPEELGRVRLTLAAGDGVLTLTVLAERPETLDLLRRNIEMLAQEFRALGYQDLAFSFGGQGQTADSDTPSNDEAITSVGAVEGEQSEETQSIPLAASGLDLRI